MKRTNLLFPAFCLLLSGCGIPQTEQTVHSVLLTRPVQAGEGQTLDFSGIVREAGEISLGPDRLII